MLLDGLIDVTVEERALTRASRQQDGARDLLMPMRIALSRSFLDNTKPTLHKPGEHDLVRLAAHIFGQSWYSRLALFADHKLLTYTKPSAEFAA